MNRFWRILVILFLVGIMITGWYRYFQQPEEVPEMTGELVIEPRVLTPINPYKQRLADEFEHYLDSLRIDRDIPAIAACIVHNGQPILITALGHKVNHTNNQVNSQTKFRLASVSKGFSSILVSLLVNDNVVQWEDPINKYLTTFHPDPLQYSDSIQIQHLISQTSGFPYQAYSNLIEDGWTLPEMIEALSHLQVATQPGTLYSYQNVAYSMIEPIVEHQTGESFDALLQDKIFDPLEMHYASSTYEDMASSENAATPHRRTRYSYVPIKLSESYYNTKAAGGINASIEDMSKWLLLLTGFRSDLISREQLSDVFEPRIPTALLNRYYRQWLGARRAYYGRGWRIVPLKEDTIIYHGGYANGFKSHIAMDRNSNTAVCILSNSSDNLVNQAGPYFFHLFYKYEALINDWEHSATR